MFLLVLLTYLQASRAFSWATIYKTSHNEANQFLRSPLYSNSHNRVLPQPNPITQSRVKLLSRLDSEERQSYSVKKASFFAQDTKYCFDYEYNESCINPTSESNDNGIDTKIVLLIHPVGVGISKWYYDDLFHELAKNSKSSDKKIIFLAPDLLGCGSACNPMKIEGTEQINVKKLPILFPADWAEQLVDFMTQYESINADTLADNNTSWCVVANGGCVPIALEIGKRYANSIEVEQSKKTGSLVPPRKPNNIFSLSLSNIILSAAPSLSSIQNDANPIKAQKAYRRLSGFLGNLFWWYALRNDGKFIQSFSEKNLASCPENLGKSWKPKCVQTAQMYNGKSRYATFSFLAGSLKGGSKERLEALRNTDVKIDVVRGVDKRKNSARR